MKEIERKFLVNGDLVPKGLKKVYIQQDYLLDYNNHTIRIRTANSKAYLTYKGPTTDVTRTEIEFRIPKFIAMMLMSEKRIRKVRHYYTAEDNHVWEVDRFLYSHLGLWLAEIELKHEREEFVLPEFVGEEVSHDARYYNSSLIKNPTNK